MNILYVKALHIIFVVTWFAGLFYIVRLFIYHTEANLKSEPERSILVRHFKVAEKRLWFGITFPSMMKQFSPTVRSGQVTLRLLTYVARR